MAETGYSLIVRLEAKLREGNYWVLTSGNLPGLLLCGKDRQKLFDDVPQAIEQLFLLNYEMEVLAEGPFYLELSGTQSPHLRAR